VSPAFLSPFHLILNFERYPRLAVLNLGEFLRGDLNRKGSEKCECNGASGEFEFHDNLVLVLVTSWPTSPWGRMWGSESNSRSAKGLEAAVNTAGRVFALGE